VTDAESSAAISAIFRVYAAASVARSMAFLNRAVAINSIVLVIFRILRIAFLRTTSSRVFAIPESPEEFF
jgi:hypothetical protein